MLRNKIIRLARSFFRAKPAAREARDENVRAKRADFFDSNKNRAFFQKMVKTKFVGLFEVNNFTF